MVADLAGKRVLVLSDNDGLSRAIEFNLKHSHLEVIRLALSSPRLRRETSSSVETCSAERQQCPELVEGRCPELVEGRCPEPVEGRCPEPVEGWESQTEISDFDLIVVAVSSSASEPVVALTRASLARQIGQVPLLIISDKPFHSGLDGQIIHLDFPFDIDGLHSKVKEILQRGSESTLMNVHQEVSA